MKKKLVCEEPAIRTPIELGTSGGLNKMYGIMATIDNLPNS